MFLGFRAFSVAVLSALVGGCAPRNAGVIELSWNIVDREGVSVFPGSPLSTDRRTSSCGLPGRMGNTDVRYDLHMEVYFCDPECEKDCSDPSCHLSDPLVFSCEAHRGSDPTVPASSENYLIAVQPVLTGEVFAKACLPAPECIVFPGPRLRKIARGLVTDLQVYEVVLALDSKAKAPLNRLDLQACGCT